MSFMLVSVYRRGTLPPWDAPSPPPRADQTLPTAIRLMDRVEAGTRPVELLSVYRPSCLHGSPDTSSWVSGGQAWGWGVGGGGGTACLRVGTQNKTTDPRFCAITAPLTALADLPVITVVTMACPQWTPFKLS